MSDSAGTILGKGSVTGWVGVGKVLEGKPGFSPTCTFEEIDGGYRFTVTDINGPKSVDIVSGKEGTPGYTPVKGTDYYTDTDKEEMVAAVLAALPAAEGSSF